DRPPGDARGDVVVLIPDAVDKKYSVAAERSKSREHPTWLEPLALVSSSEGLRLLVVSRKFPPPECVSGHGWLREIEMASPLFRGYMLWRRNPRRKQKLAISHKNLARELKRSAVKNGGRWRFRWRSRTAQSR